MDYILASQSPRRIDLMSYLVDTFETVVPTIDEQAITQQILKKAHSPYCVDIVNQVVKSLAYEKAKAISSGDNNTVIIGSDTVVYSKKQGILGKPKTIKEASEMLSSLSQETTHTVHTGVCIHTQQKLITFHTIATVHFQPDTPLQRQLIEDYIQSGAPFDKAGGYSIGDKGSLLIHSIEGDYYTILGFPISEIFRQLKKASLL